MMSDQNFWNNLAVNMQRYGVDKANEMLKQGQKTDNKESAFKFAKKDGIDFKAPQKASEDIKKALEQEDKTPKKLDFYQ